MHWQVWEDVGTRLFTGSLFVFWKQLKCWSKGDNQLWLHPYDGVLYSYKKKWRILSVYNPMRRSPGYIVNELNVKTWSLKQNNMKIWTYVLGVDGTSPQGGNISSDFKTWELTLDPKWDIYILRSEGTAEKTKTSKFSIIILLLLLFWDCWIRFVG